MNVSSRWCCLGALVAGTAQAQTTVRVNVSSSGVPTNAEATAYRSVLSGDATRVAFTTAATNLVPNDTNGTLDVMVRDLVAGTTSRASVSTGGVEGNGSSKLATISADGRYVAFESDATNLVPGDTNLATDIFLRDLQAQTTSRVSLRPNGNQCNGFSFGCSISADGRYLAFYSSATNVVQGDTNNRTDVFVRDLLLGTNVRVSESSTGLQGEGGDSV